MDKIFWKFLEYIQINFNKTVQIIANIDAFFLTFIDRNAFVKLFNLGGKCLFLSFLAKFSLIYKKYFMIHQYYSMQGNFSPFLGKTFFEVKYSSKAKNFLFS